MPVPTICPNCAAKLNVPETVLGKSIACPKCKERFAVPKPVEDFEVLDEDEAPKSPSKAKPRSLDDALAGMKPTKSKPKVVEDEDDDEEERPRTRSKSRKSVGKPAKKSNKTLLFVAGGVTAMMLLVCGAGGLFFLLRPGSHGGGILGPSAPEGWSVASSGAGGYTILLPGIAKGMPSQAESDAAALKEGAKILVKSSAGTLDSHATAGGGYADGLFGKISAEELAAGQAAPTTVEAAYKLLETQKITIGASFFKIESRTMVTLDGVQAGEFRVRDNKPLPAIDTGDHSTPPPFVDPNLPPEFRKQMEDSRKRFEQLNKDNAKKAAEDRVKDVKYYVYYIVVKNNKLYVLELRNNGSYPDQASIDLFRNSFRAR